MRVIVAMSGGVDSSVAAALMLEAGHEVVGLTMKLRDVTAAEQAGQGGTCCSPDDLMDARLVCDTLGVAHYTVDYREAFRRTVIDPFTESYLQGRTPNPCVLCNDHVKFAPLLDRAHALGADLLVTGHYARVERTPEGGFGLYKAVDPTKDQSYFLFGVDPEALARVRFPLGTLDKAAVRDKARALGLPNWDKADSEDICFVPDGDYARVVEEVAGPERVPGAGSILDEAGAVVGAHRGVHRFTVGQRKGLGVAGKDRLYVLSVDGANDTVTVGPRPRLVSAGLEALRCRWFAAPGGRPVTARIRYRHPGASAEVVTDGERALVRFDAPQIAVAPGQALVVYEDDRVLGGGWIERALPAEPALEGSHV